MVLAVAAPALAQGSGVNQNAAQVGVIDNSTCSQVYNIAVQQYNAVDQSANASAGPFGSAVAINIANQANQAGIDIATVNNCVNNFVTIEQNVETAPNVNLVAVCSNIFVNSIADMAQDASVTNNQVTQCVKMVDLNGDGVVQAIEVKKFFAVKAVSRTTPTASATATAAAAAQYKHKTAKAVQYKTATATAAAAGQYKTAKAALPKTGGSWPFSMLALGIGALLVGGGLLARKIVR